MPRKKKGSNTKVIAVLIVAVVAIGIIAIHDGLVGVTPIEDLLEGDLIDGWDINDGTAVTVKGNISSIVGDWVIIYDDTGAIGFDWNDADDLEVGMTIVVRGESDTTLLIIRTIDASSVTPVWLFA